jgi:hypothetical protein
MMKLEDDLCRKVDFISHLSDEYGYSCFVPMDDTRFACVSPFLYTTAIITGRYFDSYSLDNRWCYHDYPSALAALIEWAEAGFKNEPMGWHRHPASGRRRPDGDWMQEHVQP